MASNRKATKGASGGRPRSYSELYRNSKETVTGNDAPRAGQSTASTVVTSRQNQINWRTEYAHVMDDLRRLGVISAVLILAMVVAGFIL